LSGSDALDLCLSEASWLRNQHNDFTVGDLISQFGEFIVSLWDHNEITAHALLMAHMLTGQLSENARKHAEASEYYRASLNIMGTHMMLSRKVEDYYFALSYLGNVFGERPYEVLVEGPDDVSYYHENFAFVFGIPAVQLHSAKPYNSSILTVSGLVFLAWFLGGLKKVDLQIYSDKGKKSDPGLADFNPELEATPSVNRKKLQISYDKEKQLEIRAATIVPRTNIQIDFEMAVSTQFIGKLRSLIISLLDDQNEASRNPRITEQE